MRNFLTFSYIALAIVFAGSVAAYMFASQSDIGWLQDLALNLGTEVAGIVLTIVLIDAVIRRNEAAERLRIRRVAFQQLRIPFQHQLSALQKMYKAAATHLPEKFPVEARDLFNEAFFQELRLLDFSRPAPLGKNTTLRWADYLRIESENFKLALDRTLDKYAVFLDVDSVEMMEEILTSSYLSILIQISSARGSDEKHGNTSPDCLLSSSAMDDLFRNYIACFTRLIESHNKNLPSDQKIKVSEIYWQANFAPGTGSGRIQVAE